MKISTSDSTFLSAGFVVQPGQPRTASFCLWGFHEPGDGRERFAPGPLQRRANPVV
jgi:hypothetical protein